MIQSFRLHATHTGRFLPGPRDFKVTVDNPENIPVSIVMAEQLFLRNCTSPKSWRFYDSFAALRETAQDKKQLDKIEVLSCTPTKQERPEKLFKKGDL